MTGTKFIRPEAVAEYLDVALVTVWRWLREGKIEAVKLAA